jgi:hypothetical protein
MKEKFALIEPVIRDGSIQVNYGVFILMDEATGLRFIAKVGMTFTGGVRQDLIIVNESRSKEAQDFILEHNPDFEFDEFGSSIDLFASIPLDEENSILHTLIFPAHGETFIEPQLLTEVSDDEFSAEICRILEVHNELDRIFYT